MSTILSEILGFIFRVIMEAFFQRAMQYRGCRWLVILMFILSIMVLVALFFQPSTVPLAPR